jgi:DNA-binding transcriptional LysR family regulator
MIISAVIAFVVSSETLTWSTEVASIKNINWNLLHTFVVVAETRSISKAAQILGRGQPAISAALKNLEGQMGQQLAERGPRFFELTEAGRLLLREAGEICGAIDRISVLLKDTGDELTGNVRLTLASHMTSPIIDRTLTEFHRRHRRATISCAVMNSSEIIEALSNRLIHFGIAPVFNKRPEFEHLHVFKEYCGFYCGVSHSLFGRENLTLKDLEDQNEITYQTAVHSDYLHSITEMRHQIKFRKPLTGISANLEEVHRMIVAGMGIGAIPVQIAARDVRDGILWRLPPYENIMPIDVFMIKNDKVRASPTEQAFLKTLADEIGKASDLERGTQ